MKKKLTFAKLMMLVVMAILPLTFYAQSENNKQVEKYWYIQADGGFSINHGDLASYESWVFQNFNQYHTKDYLLSNFNGHLGLGYQMGKVVGFNIKGGLGTLAGEKHGQLLHMMDPNGNVGANAYTDLQLDKTKYYEGNINLTFNLFNLFNYNPRRVINLVPHVGVGGIYYLPGTVKHMTDNAVDEPAWTERKLGLTVPAGAEFTFNLAPKFDIFVDYTYLFTNKDDLDQVTKINSDEAKLTLNEMDMYSQLNLGLRYKFNNPCDIEKMAREAKSISYRVNPDPLVKGEDGQVCFDVIVTIPAEYFEKQAVMNFTPYMAYNGGQIDLEPITFVGEKVKGQGDFRVNYKEGGEFTKHYCKDYMPEMENCELKGNPMFYVYNGKIYPTQDDIVKNTYFTQGGERKLADGVIVTSTAIVCNEPTNLRITTVTENSISVNWNGNAESYDLYVTTDGKPNDNTKPTYTGLKNDTNFTIPNLEPGKYGIYVRSNCDGDYSDWVGINGEILEQFDIVYYFDYNRSDLPGSDRNVRERNKVARKTLADAIKAGNIKGFRIEAWASPEGEYSLNNELADDRADAALRDIKAQLKKNASNYEFKAKGNGPDWDTFMRLVENSNIADKDAILNNIRKSSNKERTIKEMINIYPQLENEILPLIRRAEVFFEK